MSVAPFLAPAAGEGPTPAGHPSAPSLLASLADRGWSVSTAESLTGGLLVASLVDVPGASAVVKGGACAYAYEAKAALLGLDLADLEVHGAVRPEVALAMARGGAAAYGSEVCLATTGVAGPGPDERGVAEGTVFVACVTPAIEDVRELHLTGSRREIREGAVKAALALGIEAMRRG